MSRLDYVTIAIVAICIAALVYLIYMLLGGPSAATSNTPAPTEQYDNTADETQTNDLYDSTELEPTPAQEDLGNEELTTPAIVDHSGEANTDEAVVPAPAPREYEEPGTPAPSAGSTGDYMVVAGSFRIKANAETQVKKLQDMGFTDASLGLFNKGTMAVVLVDRFDNADDASDLVKKLKDDYNVQAYVQKKRAGAN